VTSVSLKSIPGDLDAIIKVPGSKSVANRALVCAMLAKGPSVISGIPAGDDCEVVVRCIRDSGRTMERIADTVRIDEANVLKFPGIVDAVLAGTSSRFLTAAAVLFESTSIIDGEAALRERPMSDLHNALLALGADVSYLGEIGHLPVAISRGRVSGGDVTVPGNVSSQFISALMLIAPLLDGGLRIHIDGTLVSRSYVEMTAAVMGSFGATVVFEEAKVTVHAGQYVGCEYHVEPDYSSAAFPLVSLVLREGAITVLGLAHADMQGDSAVVQILEKMGLHSRINGADIQMSRDAKTPVLPVTIDMSDCSDLVPAIAVACCVANGVSVISGVGFIRNKESDRLGDLAEELRKAGASVEVNADGLTISGPTQWKPATFAVHHDHRLAMALSLISLCQDGIVVDSPEVVSKSWPSFFDDMSPILGASVMGN